MLKPIALFALLISSTAFGVQFPQAMLERTAPTEHPVLKPFKATFKAQVKPWNVSGHSIYTLKKTTDDTYTLTLSLEHALIDIQEKSTFKVIEGCMPVPLEYSYMRNPALGRTRTHHVAFDHGTQRAHFENNGEKGAIDIPDNVIDQLSLLIGFRCQQYEQKPLDFTVFSRKRLKKYLFKLEGTDTQQTQLGPIHSQRFMRYRPDKPDSDRITRFWLAPAYGLQLIHAFQVEGSSSTQLGLVSISPGLPAFSEQHAVSN